MSSARPPLKNFNPPNQNTMNIIEIGKLKREVYIIGGVQLAYREIDERHGQKPLFACHNHAGDVEILDKDSNVIATIPKNLRAQFAAMLLMEVEPEQKPKWCVANPEPDDAVSTEGVRA